MSACDRPPMAGGRLWLAVIERASQGRENAQCECTGQCGKHAGARCPHTHGQYRKHGGPIRLAAAPADLTIDGTAAAFVLGVDELLAWCPSCHQGAGKTARAAAAAALAEQEATAADTLF